MLLGKQAKKKTIQSENQSNKSSRFVALGIILATILGIIFFAAILVLATRWLPVKRVMVYGDNISPREQTEVRQVLKPFFNRGLLVLHLQMMRQQLQALPWIARVRLSRVWPDGVAVVIVPEHIIGTWNNQVLVNRYGEPFPMGSVDYSDGLRFSGPDNELLAVFSEYQQLQSHLDSLNLSINQLDLAYDGDWVLTLDNGIVLQLGAQDALTRLQRFVNVYPKLTKSSKKSIHSIDMRYLNGMAVSWGK